MSWSARLGKVVVNAGLASAAVSMQVSPSATYLSMRAAQYRTPLARSSALLSCSWSRLAADRGDETYAVKLSSATGIKKRRGPSTPSTRVAPYASEATPTQEAPKRCRPLTAQSAQSAVQQSVQRPPHEAWAIEGNICSGKTSWCRAVEAHPDSEIIYEQVSNEALELFYSNPERYAFWYQTHMLHSRMAAAEKVQAAASGVWFLDRTLFGDYVFAAKNHFDGNINEKEFSTYLAIRKHRGFRNLMVPMSCILYLDVSATDCYDRMLESRLVEKESEVPKEYLDGLDNVYINALLWQLASDHDQDVAVVCAEQGFDYGAFATSFMSHSLFSQRRAMLPPRPTVHLEREPQSASELRASGSLVYDSEEMLLAKVPESFSTPRDAERTPVVAFDWQLKENALYHQGLGDGLVAKNALPDTSLDSCHSNAFRRRVAYHLSKGHHVILVQDMDA